MLKFRGPIIKYIRYEGEGGSLEMRMLPLKLRFFLNWNRGGDRDDFMIITGPFMKSTFAQLSPFLTPLPLVRFPQNIIEGVRFWPDPLLPLPLSHPLTDIGVKSILNNSGWGWGEIFKNICHQPTLEKNRDIRDGTNLDPWAN